MKKNIFNIAFLVGATIFVQAQFPYTNSLQKTGTYKEISGGTGVGLNATVNSVATKGVLLTKNQISQFSGIELQGINFPTTRGFNIDFEYFQWGDGRGDGLALVLFDASNNSPSIGAKGAGLGYAYSNNYNASTITNGFSDGYLAFGFDTFGNYHRLRRQSDDIRNGIVITDPELGKSNYIIDAADYFTNLKYSGENDPANSSYFSIRGSSNNPKWIANTSSSDNSKGYPLLYTVNTMINGATSSVVNGMSLSAANDGTHGSRNINTFTPFDIRSGSYTEDIKSNAYRRAYIQFRKGVRQYFTTDPDTNPSAVKNEEILSYFADVVVETNAGQKVIAKNEQFRISATNNAANSVKKYYDPTSLSLDKTYLRLLDFRGAAPQNLKMAFTASTGASFQNQLVRNVNITLPYSPIIVSDSYTILCPDNSSVIGKPMSNDMGYNDDLYIQRYVGNPSTPTANLIVKTPIESQPNTSYLDSKSFAFMVLGNDGSYQKVNPAGVTPEDQHTLVVAGVGTFNYIYKDSLGNILSPTDTYITYTPTAGSTLASGLHSIYYSIKNTNVLSTNGNNLGTEEYRSSVGLINLNFSSTLCGKTHIITNKNITETIKR